MSENEAVPAHIVAMHRVMHFCVSTPERGWILRPDAKWDSDPEFEFTVSGRSDSNYATDSETRRSVKGHSTFLNGSPIACKSGIQKRSALSVTEAEGISGVDCAQDMLYAMHLVEGMGLKVAKLMILETDNRGFCN
eukprot:434331-Ditylum_brightwellii.AAC.1